MPYDPNYPPTNAEIESAPLRNQFNGLKSLIDAVPVIDAAGVDATNTLSPGSAAEATVVVNGSTLAFTFGIPAGVEGQPGPEGPQGPSGGPPGPEGPQGPPGEVTQNDLDDAINGTSNNSNGVSILGVVVTDPPTQGEVQAIADKLDELINALRR